MPYGVETPAWEWRIGGRYNRWYVDQYMRGDASNGMYGYSILATSKRRAQEIANALNAAFNAGVKYGASRNQDMHTGENRAEAAHTLFHLDATGQFPDDDPTNRCSLCAQEVPSYQE